MGSVHLSVSTKNLAIPGALASGLDLSLPSVSDYCTAMRQSSRSMGCRDAKARSGTEHSLDCQKSTNTWIRI